MDESVEGRVACQRGDARRIGRMKGYPQITQIKKSADDESALFSAYLKVFGHGLYQCYVPSHDLVERFT